MPPTSLLSSVSRYAVHSMRGTLVGILAGIILGFFRFSHTFVVDVLYPFLQGQTGGVWPILWGLLLVLVGLVAGYAVIRTPQISGSGIPSVELALAGRSSFAWGRILVQKFVVGWLLLVAGLSIGREGPCIQMGAAIGRGVDRLYERLDLTHNAYIIAGAAAGLSAAFGAPLGGMAFVFEEMKCRLNAGMLVCVSCAAFSAWWISSQLFKLPQLFSFNGFQPAPWQSWWLYLLLGLGLGFMGAGYNLFLLWFTDLYKRQTLLTVWKPVPPLLCAALLLFYWPDIMGGGDSLIQTLGTQPFLLKTLLLLFIGKLLFSVFSFSCGVPGGLLMPMLCLGAILGSFSGLAASAFNLLDPMYSQSFLVAGMAGYFAASVRAPLTGVMLVAEMSGAWECLPILLLVAFSAYLCAQSIHSVPVYDALKQRTLNSQKKGIKNTV